MASLRTGCQQGKHRERWGTGCGSGTHARPPAVLMPTHTAPPTLLHCYKQPTHSANSHTAGKTSVAADHVHYRSLRVCTQHPTATAKSAGPTRQTTTLQGLLSTGVPWQLHNSSPSKVPHPTKPPNHDTAPTATSLHSAHRCCCPACTSCCCC